MKNKAFHSNTEEQLLIAEQMRSTALCRLDFFLLIFLSSGIAFFGLQQNSAAVIIGAMLVAPLMGPMMAIGFFIVTGNVKYFGLAVLTTLLGILLAVGVSAAATTILPVTSVTSEILSRSEPNLYDLVVALLSGMAGAYALARPNVSASLPGVAIAVALVPPLCVVGFGLGSGQIDIAVNALLLFATNLACIVLAGLIVFWLLGFGQLSSSGKVVAFTSLALAIGGVVAVTVPLTAYTVLRVQDIKRFNAVKQVLADELDSNYLEAEDIVIQARGQGFIVGVTLYVYDPKLLGDIEAQAENVEAVRNEMEAAVGAPVTVKARVVVAHLTTLERPGLLADKLQLPVD